MKLHRQRKKSGLRCLIIELRDGEIDALIARKFLKPEMRDDREAIVDAIYGGSIGSWPADPKAVSNPRKCFHLLSGVTHFHGSF